MNRVFSALLMIVLIVHAGCSEESVTDLVAMTWSTVEYGGATVEDARVLTITEVQGPSGSKVSQLLVGKYVVKGTYDLSGQGCEGATIRLYFAPSWASPVDIEPGVVEIQAGSEAGSFELGDSPSEFRGDSAPYLYITITGSGCELFETVSIL